MNAAKQMEYIEHVLATWENELDLAKVFIENYRNGQLPDDPTRLQILIRSQMGRLREIMWGLGEGYLR